MKSLIFSAFIFASGSSSAFLSELSDSRLACDSPAGHWIELSQFSDLTISWRRATVSGFVLSNIEIQYDENYQASTIILTTTDPVRTLEINKVDGAFNYSVSYRGTILDGLATQYLTQCESARLQPQQN